MPARTASAVFALALLAPSLPGTGLRAEPVPEEAVLAELPFLEPEQTQRVIVDLAPEGSARPFELMLDTGAQWSVLTPRVARALGVSVRRTRDRPYRRATRLGRDLQFWVDTSRSDTGSATFEYGLLGGQFLAKYVVEIDYPGRQVRFLDPDRYRVPEQGHDGAAVLPLRLVDLRPFVEVGLGPKRVWALLDTGHVGTLDMREETAREIGLEPKPLEGFRLWGVLGPYRSLYATLPGLLLGPHRLEQVPVLALKGDFNIGGSDGVMLGHDVLARFRLRIDYPRRRLWMEYADAVPQRFFGYDAELVRRAGLLARPVKGGLEVTGLVAESPAARLGIRIGERIPLEEERRHVAPDVEELAERIEAGGPIVVLHRAGASWEESVRGGTASEVAPAPAEGG